MTFFNLSPPTHEKYNVWNVCRTPALYTKMLASRISILNPSKKLYIYIYISGRLVARSGTIWANSALMNLWIVCHDGYRHSSLQGDVLLGIRGTGVYCNLEHNLWKCICMMVRIAICGFHEKKKELICCLCGSQFHFYVKVPELVKWRWCKTFFDVWMYVCIYAYIYMYIYTLLT